MNKLLESIESQFVQLNYRWLIFCQLFDSGQENIDLLNASGSNVFQLFQKIIIDDTMNSLCRLTDSASTGKNKNASIPQLLETYKLNFEEAEFNEFNSQISEIKIHMVNIRKLRNKSMNHSDLEHSLGIKPPIRVTYDEIENSIEAIRKLLSNIRGNSSDYTPKIPYGLDGSKLLTVLAKAHQ